MIKRLFYYVFLAYIIVGVIDTPSLIDRSLGRLPVLHDGRIKPFDTLARHYLLQIQGRLKLPDELSPTQWLFSMMTVQDAYLNSPIILVEHPKLFDSIDPKYRKQKYRLSQSFLDQHFDLIEPFVSSARLLEKEERTPFQQSAYLLSSRYFAYMNLRAQFFPFKNKSQLTFWNDMLRLSHLMNRSDIKSSPDFKQFLSYYNLLSSFESSTYFIYGSSWQSLSQAALDKTQKNKTLLSTYLLLSDSYNQFLNAENDVLTQSNKNEFMSIQMK